MKTENVAETDTPYTFLAGHETRYLKDEIELATLIESPP